jgi:hypothetical protein
MQPGAALAAFRQPADARKKLSEAENMRRAWNDALARKDANARDDVAQLAWHETCGAGIQTRRDTPAMTPLQRTLKRLLTINGLDYVIAISPEGLKLAPKGKRRGIEFQWEALVSGEAALAAALQASVGQFAPPAPHPPSRPKPPVPSKAGASGGASELTQEPSDKQLAESTEHGKKARAVETTTGKR